MTLRLDKTQQSKIKTKITLLTNVFRIGEGEESEEGVEERDEGAEERIPNILRSSSTYQAGLGACFLPISAKVVQQRSSSSLLQLEDSILTKN